MLSRLTYTLRETWASFKRNVTLTVAAIITSAVSLLIFGLTLLIQHGFDNLLVKWEGGIEMIVNVRAQASDDQRAVISQALDQQRGVIIQSYVYCDVECRCRATGFRRRSDLARAAQRDEHPDPVQGRAQRGHRGRHPSSVESHVP